MWSRRRGGGIENSKRGELELMVGLKVAGEVVVVGGVGLEVLKCGAGHERWWWRD